jgi:hypothetical protein
MFYVISASVVASLADMLEEARLEAFSIAESYPRVYGDQHD